MKNPIWLIAWNATRHRVQTSVGTMRPSRRSIDFSTSHNLTKVTHCLACSCNASVGGVSSRCSQVKQDGFYQIKPLCAVSPSRMYCTNNTLGLAVFTGMPSTPVGTVMKELRNPKSIYSACRQLGLLPVSLDSIHKAKAISQFITSAGFCSSTHHLNFFLPLAFSVDLAGNDFKDFADNHVSPLNTHTYNFMYTLTLMERQPHVKSSTHTHEHTSTSRHTTYLCVSMCSSLLSRFLVI